MSDKDLKKEEGAIRLMEALSGIDEDLLSRCEQAAADKGIQSSKQSKIVSFMNRYGKLCSACLCLVVLGTAYFGMTRLRQDGEKSFTTMPDGLGFAPENIAEGDADGALAMLENKLVSESDLDNSILDMLESTEPAKTGGTAQTDEIPQLEGAMQTDGLTAANDANINEADVTTQGAEDNADKEMCVDYEKLLEQAKNDTQIGKVFPKYLPEGTEIVYVESYANASYELLYTSMKNGDLPFVLGLIWQKPEGVANQEIAEGFKVTENWWEPLTEEADENGYIYIERMLSEMMKLEYSGSLPFEEIQKIFASVGN